MLAIPAADCILWTWRRFSLLRYPIGFVLTLSVGIVVSASLVRFARYVSDRTSYVAMYTQHFDPIQWMNMHLDPTQHRVATYYRASGYLRIPWMNLGSDFQVAISTDEAADADRLRVALKREGFTHLFGMPETFREPPDCLVPLYVNPSSRIGGARFFRTPPTEPVTVFALK